MLEAIVKQWFNVYCTRTAAQKDAAKKFKDEVITAAKDRNTICHGFSGITTSPPTYSIICWEMYHKHRMAGHVPPVRHFSQIDLANMCDQLGGFSRELERLTKVAIDRPKKKPIPKSS